VALPLCLGIAVASGAPPLSGIIAGVVGGIAVGIASGSHLMVSGPAAGLTAIVLAGIQQAGSFSRFLRRWCSAACCRWCSASRAAASSGTTSRPP
jgi:MFS superfamily sulfate permease-like transporter